MSYKTLISANELRGLTSTVAVTVLDCQFNLANPRAGLSAYLAAHIPGAVFVDVNRDLSSYPGTATGRHPLPAAADLAATMRRLGVDPHSQVVVYDDNHGVFAARAWWLLRWAGHEDVAVLDGSLKAWLAIHGPIESGEHHLPPSHFMLRRSLATWVATAELAALLNDPSSRLIDARPPERFSGANDPIDPVAGHVPGAINHPTAANLRSDGRFKSPSDLRHRFDSLLGGAPANKVISMCGSGVTACHNLLALETAGLHGGRLYAGSWSEWIRDGSRPVATGP
jgi:thiosulfate/3-mercaptopyruvate sulfurtransferase